MDVKIFDYIINKTKYFLVFFCLLILSSCNSFNEEYFNLSINNDLNLDLKLYKNPKNYKVRLKGSDSFVLGDIVKEDATKFVPIIPFTKGETYEVLYEDAIVGEFTIQNEDDKKQTKLLAIYPQIDTVPENLLKIYLQFSKPMQEVKDAKDFLKVINQETKQEEDIFLDLETELWNLEHNELTLWLDPGRIKKDLIPNKEKGNPIKLRNTYTINISKDWKDAEGLALEKEYQKTFYVSERDTKQPTIADFKFKVPKENTMDELEILCNEDLDMMLIRNNLKIYRDDKPLTSFKIEFNKSSIIKIIPNSNWKKGLYKIVIASQQEDLAGNNFMRLFDRDVTQDTVNTEKNQFLNFTIQ